MLFGAEILVPVVESCPGAPLVYTSRDGSPVLVARPDVSFRSAMTPSAGPLVARCSHFVDGRTRWLDVGRHKVTCTAQDPQFGDRAVANCVFTIHVQGCIPVLTYRGVILRSIWDVSFFCLPSKSSFCVCYVSLQFFWTKCHVNLFVNNNNE